MDPPTPFRGEPRSLLLSAPPYPLPAPASHHGLPSAASGLESPSIAVEEDLANHMGLFLQKTNIIRDYLVGPQGSRTGEGRGGRWRVGGRVGAAGETDLGGRGTLGAVSSAGRPGSGGTAPAAHPWLVGTSSAPEPETQPGLSRAAGPGYTHTGWRTLTQGCLHMRPRGGGTVLLTKVTTDRQTWRKGVGEGWGWVGLLERREVARGVVRR